MPRPSRPSPPTTGVRWPPTCSSSPTRPARCWPRCRPARAHRRRTRVTAALGGREVVEFRPDAGGVLQVATVPIAIGLESPDVLGTVSVGVRLDAQMAERFKRATRSEVAFTLDGTVRAATLPPSTWPALAAAAEPAGVCRGSSSATPSMSAARSRSAPATSGEARPTGRRRGAGRARAAIAHRAAGIPAHRLRRAGAGRRGRRAAGRRPQLRRGAHHHASAGRHHGDDARGGGHRRPDAEDPAARAVGLAGRGRAAAGDDLQHAHRFGGALSARGRAEGTAPVARPAVDGHRARSAQPADDHQGRAAEPAAGGAGRATSAKR